MKQDKKGASKLAFMLSALAVILAAAVSLFGASLWLAGTQWILIAILLSVWAVFLKE